MTLNEFKAWLEGYEESFQEYGPTTEQWAKIKDKLKEVVIIKPTEPLNYKTYKDIYNLPAEPKVWL